MIFLFFTVIIFVISSIIAKVINEHILKEDFVDDKNDEDGGDDDNYDDDDHDNHEHLQVAMSSRIKGDVLQRVGSQQVFQICSQSHTLEYAQIHEYKRIEIQVTKTYVIHPNS